MAFLPATEMQLLCIMAVCAAVGYSTAYYHGTSSHGLEARDVIDPRDVIEHYESIAQKRGEEIVACPVCSQFSTGDECTLELEGKRYKRCMFGTYINEVCGNRRDCYRGPREYCTEKMADDKLGARCARGYVCNAQLHECVGLFNDLDSLELAGMKHYYILPQDNGNRYIDRYPLARSRHAY